MKQKRIFVAVLCLVVIFGGIISVVMINNGASPSSGATADSAVTHKDISLPSGSSQVLPLTNEQDKVVTEWVSSDESVAAVDSGGRIDALKEGKAEISVRVFNGNLTPVCSVTVTKPAVQPEADKFTTAITANQDILEKNLKSTEKNKTRPYRLHVNRKMNCVTAYTYDSDGKYTVPVRAMVCSCGLNNGTITGTYNIYFHTEWHPLTGGIMGQYASAIAGDYMFHSVPYTDYSKATLETEEYNKLGEEASQGCIRMAVADVKWINDNCEEGTVVIIFDNDNPGPLGKPEGIKITDLNCKWDPTDYDKDNPYNNVTPTIKGAKNVTLTQGDEFSTAKGVTATDTCGNDITSKIEVTGNVNTERPGVYRVTYEVTDALHRSAKTDVTVTVERKELS